MLKFRLPGFGIRGFSRKIKSGDLLDSVFGGVYRGQASFGNYHMHL